MSKYRRVTYIFIVILSGWAMFVHAQTPNPAKIITADSILQQRGELFFSFILPPALSVQTITKIVSIDKIKGPKIWAYANRKEMGRFLSLDIDFNIENRLAPVTMQKTVQKTFTSWNQYPTYEQYDSLMKNYPVIFPGLCKLEEIGKSVKGRSLYYMKLGNHADIHGDKPEVLFSGCMHGDELAGYILPLHLIDYLLNNYNNPDVKALMDTAEIWICPLANPDGTYFGGNNTVAKSIRYNANYIDLNRNFPDVVVGDHPDNNDWQPENIAVMKFLTQHNFVLSANFHSGSELVNYPWDTKPELHADDTWFQQISRHYADTVHRYSPANFFIDLNNGITNGYGWYSIQGGRQDYVTYFKHGREVTIELDSLKIIPEKDLSTYWNYHYRSMMNYLKEINYGIRGKITDKATGLPLKAEIYIPGHDADQSQIFSDTLTGMYYRMIAPGTYSLTCSVKGYQPVSIQNVNVTDKSQKQQNIEMEAIPEAVSEKTTNHVDYIFPNPVLTTLNIHFTPYPNNKIHIVIVDSSGKTVITDSYTGSNPFIQIPVTNLFPGIYFLRLQSNKDVCEIKFIKQ